MIEQPHIINNIHASTLIGAGVASYFLNENRPATALIAPAFGGALLLLSPGIKKENPAIAHAAVGVTGLILAITTSMLVKAVKPDPATKAKFSEEVLTRRANVFGLMSLTGIAALGVYVKGFIDKRKQKQQV